MRHFHKTTQKYFCPTVNVDKLTSLITAQVCIPNHGYSLLPAHVMRWDGVATLVHS